MERNGVTKRWGASVSHNDVPDDRMTPWHGGRVPSAVRVNGTQRNIRARAKGGLETGKGTKPEKALRYKDNGT